MPNCDGLEGAKRSHWERNGGREKGNDRGGWGNTEGRGRDIKEGREGGGSGGEGGGGIVQHLRDNLLMDAFYSTNRNGAQKVIAFFSLLESFNFFFHLGVTLSGYCGLADGRRHLATEAVKKDHSLIPVFYMRK